MSPSKIGSAAGNVTCEAETLAEIMQLATDALRELPLGYRSDLAAENLREPPSMPTIAGSLPDKPSAKSRLSNPLS